MCCAQNPEGDCGVLCGLWSPGVRRASDSAYYTEVAGSYTDAAVKRHERAIPQFVLEGNPYDGQSGHVLKITVR